MASEHDPSLPAATTPPAPAVEDAWGRPDPPEPRLYRQVDPAAELREFEPLEKCGGLYVARLRRPLWVQTPPLTLASPLEDEDGEAFTHVHLMLPRQFADFARAVEARVLDACLERKEEWFKRAVTDDSLRASFKEFLKPGGQLKVRVPRDALVFDEGGALAAWARAAPGGTVRCLLELSRVCFGRTEFGAMWSLLQAQVAPAPAPPPRCMIDPAADAEETVVEPRGADAEVEMREFL